VVDLGRRDEESENESEVRVAQRERPAADPRHAPAEDVELLAGLGLGGVGEEGVLDLGHAVIVSGRPARPVTRGHAGPAVAGLTNVQRVEAAAARLRLGAVFTGGPGPVR